MPTILHLEEIKTLLSDLDMVEAMEKGFIQYSNGNTVVPPVGELISKNPPGDTHIKYGYIKEDDFYVIKIASGFYENPKLGLSSSQGLLLVFSQKTGQLESILLDEGYLTNVRTAAAGALAAKYFAPKNTKAIGVIGTGIQAKMQIEFLLKILDVATLWIWGRNPENAINLKDQFSQDLKIHIAKSTAELAQNCQCIVTTTPSTIPLLQKEDILPGTHITAVGSDTSEKQELEGAILGMADIVIADSIPQSESRGEVYQAIQQGFIKKENIIELGCAIQNAKYQRQNDNQISVVDLTGVAVQDIMIAKAVYLAKTLKTK